MRNYLVPLAVGCIGVIGSGCNLTQPYPAKDSFVLRAGAIDQSPVKLPESVRVEPVRIAPPFDARSLVTRTGEVSFSRDYFNVFIAPPDELATAELIRLLTESGVFTRVSGAGSAGTTDVSLECIVTDLYADERNPANAVAVCRAKFRRLKNELGSTIVIDDQMFESTAPISSNSGEGIAAALGQTFGATVKKYIDSVGAPPKKSGV
ncbi:MAG: ABC-type transport auxiliary lipoprotein family protein [Phycisphaerales bacterium]